ncbi:MAG: hypothetical protein KAT68_08565, partial [Bacteroidales bacterium]|nr:hypothetical protein [Bacteroidales bacterium]
IETEELKKLLNKFVNLRILRDKDESGRYELRHDSLAAKIYEKISIVEKEMMEVRQFVENAYNTYEKRGILLNREDLKYLNKYENNLFLPGLLDDFVLKSKNYEKSKSKVVKYITAITAIIFGLSLVFLLIFIYRTSKRNIAVFNASQSIFQVQPIEYRYFKAKKAYLSFKSATTQKGIFNAYFELLENENYKDTLVSFIPILQACDTTIVDIDFSKNGEIIYAYTTDNKVAIWNIDNNEFNIFETSQDSLIAIELASNNKYFATISIDSIAKIRDIEGNFIFSCKVAYHPLNKMDILCFSSSRKNIITLSPDNDFEVYDIAGNLIQKVKKHQDKVNSLAISDNEQFIATASCDCTINIWYYNTIKKQYDIYNTIEEHKDTVWSVNFSKKNQFIVTASADSNALVISVNGGIYDCADDFFTYYWEDHYSKICYAEFSNSEREIILTRYGDEKSKEVDLPDWVYNFYSLQQNFDKNMIYKTADVTGKRHKSEYLFYSAAVNNRFKEISFSKNGELSCVIPYNTTEVWFLHALYYYKIKEFNANKAMFSPDGKYLLIVNQNEMKLIPVNIDNIINMIDSIIEFK